MPKKKTVEKKTVSGTERVTIPPVETEIVQIPIRNLDGPLVVHNWSAKAIAEMLAKQMGERVAGKTPKDPEECFQQSLYTATDGTYGFPACAFKNAMIRAAKGIEGLDMITMRQLVFIVADCEEDRKFTVPLKDGKTFSHSIRTPLTRIIGTPKMRMDMVRLNGKTADIRFRGEFVVWEAVLTIRYISNRISAQEIANLVNLAGHTVGVGEGRPEKSTDMTWGRWQVDTKGGK